MTVCSQSSAYRFFLSSIASTELRKIIFLVGDSDHWLNIPSEMKRWASIDEQMCGLVDRLRAMGYCHTLEAEVRLRPEVGDALTIEKISRLLPKFREKGIVSVVDIVHPDRIFHSSVRNH